MNNQVLKDKVAIITGAGNGIGREMALLFAANGAAVVVADINGFAGEETVDLIRQKNGNAIYVNVNISKADECKNMITVAEKSFGKLDILCNNAAIMHHLDGDIVSMEEKTWDVTMLVNVKGTFLSCKYGIPALLKTRGVIINTSSFTALRGSSMANMAYSASKAAIIALTQDLAAKYAKHKLRVNVLCPGPTLTESFRRYLSESPEREVKYLESIPMQHFADVKDIAKAALFLASDSSSYMTGATLVIDGGISSTAILSD